MKTKNFYPPPNIIRIKFENDLSVSSLYRKIIIPGEETRNMTPLVISMPRIEYLNCLALENWTRSLSPVLDTIA